jgi:IS5 family transposase
VATQDTVTLIRSAIRALLRIVDDKLGVELRSCCKRDDDYVAPGKPSCDWDDAQAREALVDALARDANAILAILDGRTLVSEVKEAAKLVATVVGQDLEQCEDGVFRIARRVAKDRVISTVDPEARHGHKTAARGFDGYKAHIAIDPDSEIITATEVTPGNAGDASAAEALLVDVLSPSTKQEGAPSDGVVVDSANPAAPVEVFGDSSYGTAELVEKIEAAGAVANVKVQAPAAPAGCFGKDAFKIDLDAKTVTCPAGVLVQIRKRTDDGGIAMFGAACGTCALRARCTDAAAGRAVRIHPKEATLQRCRMHQSSSIWRAYYRATRPKVERKLAHLTNRRHGGRRARVRGTVRVGHDHALNAAAHNLARLARLGAHFNGAAWTCAAPEA